MQVQNINDSIRQYLAQGYSEADLRNYLRFQGWEQAAVDQAFVQYYAANPGAVPGVAQNTVAENSGVQTPPMGANPLAANAVFPNPAGMVSPVAPAPQAMGSSKRLIIAIGVALIAVTGSVIAMVLTQTSGKEPTKQSTTQTQTVSNVDRQNDISTLAATFANYMSNNSGSVPSSVKAGATASAVQVCGSTCSGDGEETASLRAYRASGITFKTYDALLKVPDLQTVYIVTGATCSDDQTGIGGIGGTRAVAFLYAVTDGSKTAQQCLAM